MRLRLSSFESWVTRAVIVTVAAGLAPASASATTDSGRGARLFALVGEPAQHALLGYCDLETGCELFLLDLSAPELRRIEVREDDEFSDMLDFDDSRAVTRAYLATLPQPLREELSRLGVRSASSLTVHERLPSPADLRGGNITVVGPHVVETDHGAFEASVRVNSRIPSMAAFDSTNGEYCDGNPRCTSCGPRSRTLDGETITTFVCAATPDPSCDCRAEAHIVRFRVTHRESSTVSLGNRWIVAPYRLAQVMMGEERGTPPNMAMEIMAVSAVDAGDAIVFWGEAAHEPSNNGTYYPLVAIARVETSAVETPLETDAPDPGSGPADPPSAATASPEEDTPAAEAPPAAEEPAPAAAGCDGCSATGPLELYWPLALVVLWARRRRVAARVTAR